MENRVDPDQLFSQKLADLALHCFQNRIYQHLAWYGLFSMFVKILIYHITSIMIKKEDLK